MDEHLTGFDLPVVNDPIQASEVVAAHAARLDRHCGVEGANGWWRVGSAFTYARKCITPAQSARKTSRLSWSNFDPPFVRSQTLNILPDNILPDAD